MTSNHVRELAHQGIRFFYSPMHDREVTLIGFHLDDACCGIVMVLDSDGYDYECIDTVDLTTLKEVWP